MQNRSYTRAFAQFISRAFGPLSVVPLVNLYLFLFQTGLSPEKRLPIGIILFLSSFVLPVLITLYFLVTKRISDLDVTKREERNTLLTILIVIGWVGVFWAMQYDPPATLIQVAVFSASVFTLTAVITLFDKISLHAAGITVLYLILNTLSEWRYWWLFPIIFFVLWSRLYLHKHNPRQLFLGTLVPVLVFLTEYMLVLE